MKFFLLLASAALVSARSRVFYDELEYGFCDGANQPATIDKIEVIPFPVQLHSGASLTISAQITLNEVVPQGAQVKLNLVKEGLIPLPIPCLEIPDSETGEIQHIGSCTYDADYLLEKFSDFLCPSHVPEGQTCATPLNPGVYGGDPPIEVVIPEIPDIIVNLVGAGPYSAEATVILPDGSEMTCIYLHIQLA